MSELLTWAQTLNGAPEPDYIPIPTTARRYTRQRRALVPEKDRGNYGMGDLSGVRRGCDGSRLHRRVLEDRVVDLGAIG